MKFRDVIGHEDLKSRLVQGVDCGRVSHAQMFTGQSGSGTLSLALAYAQYINCTNKQDGDSCGACASCIKYEALEHPDLHFVFPITSKGGSGSQKPGSDTFLTQWRELFLRTQGYFDEQAWYRTINIDNQQGLIARHESDNIIRKLSFKAFEAEYKVMIIWMPERMRVEAANGLLKILEEPWDKTLFILVSEEPDKLLQTILSRVQQVAVPGIQTEIIEGKLLDQYPQQSDKSRIVARLSAGNILEAMKLMESEAEGAGKEYFQLFTQLMRFSYNDRHMELIEWGESVAGLGREEQKRFLNYSVKMLRENYILNTGLENLCYLWGEELEFSRKFSPFIGSHNVEKLVEEIESAIFQVGQNGNPRIIFPHFALAVSKLIVRR